MLARIYWPDLLDLDPPPLCWPGAQAAATVGCPWAPAAASVRPAEMGMQGDDPVRGVVPLANKRVPTEDLPAERHPTDCCLSYGPVDIAPFAERMAAQPVEFWEDEGKENVKIARPFHDNLGVKKVIFLFSTTEGRPQVFQLPLWESWKDLLLPIFSQCGLEERQVVRCLLARMPPAASSRRTTTTASGWPRPTACTSPS